MSKKEFSNNISGRRRYMAIIFAMITIIAGGYYAVAQYVTSTLPPPPPYSENTSQNSKTTNKDSVNLKYKIAPTAPSTYTDLEDGGAHPIDLKTPSNIKTEVEYDPTTGCYVVHTKIGDMDICSPFLMSANEYEDMTRRQSLIEYYQKKNSEEYENDGKKPFNFLDMQFGLGPLEKIFGPGGVQLKTQGSIALNIGIKSNKTDNPALSVNSRRRTYFNFDEKIQATINASVGDKLKFNMSYNTDATFDFDTKNIKLNYEGKEDEIIKNIEAGNVSMTTGSSLIKGSTSLFGLKTKLQFGRLTTTLLVSQQNSETQTVNTKGGAQTTPFSINCDNYDQNRHFFLGHFFRDNYDQFASKLPAVTSGVNITRIEVWVTNKKNDYNSSRNLVAFMDLAETDSIHNHHWRVVDPSGNPYNNDNTLLNEIKNDYPDARYINKVSEALDPLSAYGINGGTDYEKIESARPLASSEYTLNQTLGYISLKTALAADEVLAVAYEYTYRGKTYQVGEFSSDVTTAENCLFVKMLKAGTVAPRLPIWHLMMKNVYNLGGYQIQKKNFKLNIKYLSDTTGTEINYLPVPGLNDKTLLQILNVDNIDASGNYNSDGFFDYIEGYTIIPATGRIIFPEVEPFGRYLEKRIGDKTIADKFTYKELYDSTLVIAQQYQDKNKFIMSGEYQASSGSQIRLNAINVAKGSVVVTAGGQTLTENSDYTVDYNMGIVTIINQSIIDAGTPISVSLENQSMFSTQRKTLFGFDLNYQFNKDFSIGGTFMHYGEKNMTEKVGLGQEAVNNSIWGLNLSYKKQFMWLTNLLNKIPTVNAVQPSSISLTAEFAHLIPHKQKTGSNKGSSYLDDFETTQSGIDLRSPYSWFLASTPYMARDKDEKILFPEASLSDNVDYGKNRSLLSWYYIDRMFTQRNSNTCPGYIRNDLKQQSNFYVREITSYEIYPNKELAYGESSTLQTLNLSFYPKERGPYNLDTDYDLNGNLNNPTKRWGGIMRKLDNTNFQTSNIQYIQFWLLDPFLDPEVDNKKGGDLYFNLGEISEDILKDGMKAYENGIPFDGDDSHLVRNHWGAVSNQTSLTYAFDNAPGAREKQDVGLNGLSTADELNYPTYFNYVDELRRKMNGTAALAQWEMDPLSPINDPGGDNYHFFRGRDYDEAKYSILERYKHYNGVEGNSLSNTEGNDPYYQSSRSTPDVEDINQDNTLNEYERYFQYRVSIRPEDFVVGSNFITDMQTSIVRLRDGSDAEVRWYQFKIPLDGYDHVIGAINDFTTIRFMRMFMTGFEETTHLRFANFGLVRGEWRPYQFDLNSRSDIPVDKSTTMEMSAVNIEENAGSTPVNYVLPPGVNRIVDSGSSQATQLNEQSLLIRVHDLKAGDSRGVYKNSSIDLRLYKRLQMFTHCEALINESGMLKDGDFTMFIRLGSDVKKNFYEYEIPLTVTAPGKYNNFDSEDRRKVWPTENMLDCATEVFTNVKLARNEKKRYDENVNFNTLYYEYDPEHPANRVSVLGNPSLSNVKVIYIGIRNRSNVVHSGTIWVDELRATDFDDKGGWAAKGNINLAISDIATVNAGIHRETVGFGAVDQSLTNRRTDQYDSYNVAVQVDLGRFLPEKVKLKAPIYYSYAKQVTTPEYNPLDQDIKLKDALDACATNAEKDSIRNFAVERRVVESFSVSGLKFDYQSKNPMPWDPANFTFNYSSNKQRNNDATNDHEHTSDYRGSFAYAYSPYIKPFTPFGFIKSKNKNVKFIKEWQFRYVPNSISFTTNISRYYYEQQTRADFDSNMSLPLSISKNFIWDRQFNLTWNFTQSLNMSFTSNTTAHIDEPIGAVNKKLFPDKYKEWRDSIWTSIKNLGTPWAYNQTFTASYKAPFNKIQALNFITANATYNSSYKWDRGTDIGDLQQGNTIGNQSSWNVDGRLNFEQLFNKSKYLSNILKRFSGSNRQQQQKKTTVKPRKFERTYKLRTDTSVIIKHNLNTKKLKISATTTSGTPFKVETKVIDENSIEVITRGAENIKFSIREEIKEEKKNFFTEASQYALRFVMMPKALSVRWKRTQSLSLPQFIPNIGDVFGQSTHYGPMAPGLGFAFGFEDESYIEKAKNRGWLLCDESQTTPAISAKTTEYHFELTLEPIAGLKITLTSNLTDSRTTQYQFMYADMPTTYSGTYTRTHWAFTSAFKSMNASNGYQSDTFDRMLDNISVVKQRLLSQYAGTTYPDAGFISGTPYANAQFNPEIGTVNEKSSDVLVPAFLAAYSGRNINTITLKQFPGLGEMRPNWKITYDGLLRIPWVKSHFKSMTLTHAYQCTYSVGSFTSFANYVNIGGGRGFALDELTQSPIPSSPYNITSVSINEKFAPLIGLNATLKNNLTFNLEYRDSRTLTLNSASGQVVEALQKGLVIGAGYKIANFNTILKMKGSGQGISHDLTMNLDFQLTNNRSLIRRIVEDVTTPSGYINSTQATSGTRALTVNFTAKYILSKLVTLGMFFDQQVNTPLVSTSAYPTSNTNVGVSINISLTR